MSDVGSHCQVAAAPDGHALLLSIPGSALTDASINTADARQAKVAKQKAGHELMALPAQLQLQAVQVIVCLEWQCLPAATTGAEMRCVTRVCQHS
jgi:hypothetical protein